MLIPFIQSQLQGMLCFLEEKTSELLLSSSINYTRPLVSAHWLGLLLFTAVERCQTIEKQILASLLIHVHKWEQNNEGKRLYLKSFSFPVCRLGLSLMCASLSKLVSLSSEPEPSWRSDILTYRIHGSQLSIGTEQFMSNLLSSMQPVLMKTDEVKFWWIPL